MADRVTHTCPNCGEVAVFFYDESSPSSCDNCCKHWKVRHMLIEIPNPWYQCDDCGEVHRYEGEDEVTGCIICNSPNLTNLVNYNGKNQG
jgi:uncharacterized Zn finger protein